MDFGRRREIVNINGKYGYNNGSSSHSNGNGNGNGLICERNGIEKREYDSEDGPIFDEKSFPVVSSSPSSSSSSSPSRYIEHRVTKMDTLAGVAIRYGVEVADIKKMNNLTTDLQMFALKTLKIPLPGRHPPSPCLSNGHGIAGPCNSERTPTRQAHNDFLGSFQSLRITPDRKVSPSMSSLRGYYGLNEPSNSSEGFEMALYSIGTNSYSKNDRFSTPLMNPPLSQHRRSRSVANGFKSEEDDLANDMDDAAKWIESLNKRRQKSEADFSRTPEKVLKEENGSGSWFSAITGKGLALRSKVSSRTNLMSDAEAGGASGFLFSSGDSNGAESSSGVRKSSSTSSLQDQQDSNNNSSSLWSAAKWSLKPDLQAALAKPIFDGLPPITGRKSKAALD